MSTRYFRSSNLSLPIKARGLQFEFEPIAEFGGLWFGIYKAEKAEEGAALQTLGQRGVTEINAEEYESYLKKKVRSPDTSTGSEPPPVTPGEASLPTRIDPKLGVVVAKPVVTKTLPEVELDEVVRVGKVKAPETNLKAHTHKPQPKPKQPIRKKATALWRTSGQALKRKFGK